VVLLGALATHAQVQPVAVTIDAGKTGAPISKYVYGQFIEHIGGIINNGIWAEMVDDRNFITRSHRNPPPMPQPAPGLLCDAGA